MGLQTGFKFSMKGLLFHYKLQLHFQRKIMPRPHLELSKSRADLELVMALERHR